MAMSTEYMLRWRESNRDHVAAYRKKYYEKNREKLIAAAMQRTHADYPRFRWRARVAAANKRYPGRITVKDLDALLQRQGPACYHCGKTGLADRDLTIEHLQPVNNMRHVVLSCHACNCAKKHIPKLTREEKLRRQRARLRQWRKDNPDKVAVQNLRSAANRRKKQTTS